MSVRVVAYWSTLFSLARAEAQAEKDGDPEAWVRASEAHEEYRQICLNADEVRW